MLRNTVSRFTRLLRNVTSPPILNATRTSPRLKARLGLEQFEAREVPAAFTWTGAVSTNSWDPDNWATDSGSGGEDPGEESPNDAIPTDGDDVYFGAMSSGYHDCVNLFPDSGAYNSLTLAAGYDGTVRIAEDTIFITGDFTLAGGAIAQPSLYITAIEITGVFTWTGGVLNSNTYGGSVYIHGGGTITPPQDGQLVSGSNLIFGSSDGQVKTTNVYDYGSIVLTGTLTVNAKADVINRVLRQTDVASEDGWKPATGLLTLNDDAWWGYVGNGNRVELFRVANLGGKFYVGDNSTTAINLTLKPKNAADAAYVQNNVKAKLEIRQGCVLDVRESQGVLVQDGLVFIRDNPLLTGANDTRDATIKGNYTMTGGSIGFPDAHHTIPAGNGQTRRHGSTSM